MRQIFVECKHKDGSTIFAWLDIEQVYSRENKKVFGLREINQGEMVPCDVFLNDLEIIGEC